MAEVQVKEIIRETDKAWFIADLDDNEDWYPKSHCEMSDDGLVLTVPEWLLDQKRRD